MHSMYQIITNQFSSGQVQFLCDKFLWTTSLKFLGITRLDMIQQSKMIQDKTITLVRYILPRRQVSIYILGSQEAKFIKESEKWHGCQFMHF